MHITLTQLNLSILALASQGLSHPNSLEPRAQSITDCLTSKNVPYSISTSPDWNSLVKPYNLRLAYQPAVITLPTTSQQVSDSVTCAAASGLKVQAKSGGHSYASFSSGGKDGSLIINLQGFQSIVIDGSTGVATVGGGVRLGNMALGIYNQGKRALPHGTCPGVGIGGHFTHGGYGHASRYWGLALDTIVGLDVVLANGSQIHATKTQYPDVYFAMRGAADMFGIVTSFYLQTKPAPTTVINWSVSIPAVYNDINNLTNAFLGLQKLVANPVYIQSNISFGIYTDGSSFSIGGWCLDCDQNKFKTITLPAILNGFPSPSSTTITPSDWTTSLQSMAGSSPLQQPLTDYDLHDTFYAKSIVTKNAKPLTAAALKSFFTYVVNQGRSAPSPWFSIINLYGGAGSQINVPPVGSSAYSDRDALWVFQNYGFTSNSQPPYNPAITTFIDNMNTALTNPQPDGDFGAYLNYLDPDLTQNQVIAQYYGQTLYNQLIQIKSEIDPGNLFWNPQAITVETSSSPSQTSTSTSSSSTPTPTSNPPSTFPITTDGTCGPSIGKTCKGSTFGNCCSAYNYCGSTTPYCGTGCKSAFGDCSVSSSSSSFLSSTSSSSTSKATATSLPISNDATCGSTVGKTCKGSTFGNCCSAYNYCGSTTAYCGSGCQPGFGTCGGASKKLRRRDDGSSLLAERLGSSIPGNPIPAATS